MQFPITIERNRIKKVLILLPLHRENLTSYLSPLLGQYGIRNSDFVEAAVEIFNTKTSNVFAPDIKADDLELGLSDEVFNIPVYLSVYKNGKYLLNTQYSLIGSIYRNEFKKKRRFYRKRNLYRNLKKLAQLTTFGRYINQVYLPATNCLAVNSYFSYSDVFFLNIYKEVRNSVHGKD